MYCPGQLSSQVLSSKGQLNSNKSADNVVICPFSNIKIIRPLITIEEFKSRMSDKKMVKLNNIKLQMNKKTNDIDGDFVTIGIIADKLPIRKTKTGSDFSIWKLTDLQSLDKFIILMLFGDAHETQWKLSKGSVIALLNPKILPNKDAKSDLTISIERGSKLMHLGSSKDLGNCRAPKNNGDMCNTLINSSNGNYCIYHIKMDYSKLSSLRPELQAAMHGIGVKTNSTLQTIKSFKKEQANNINEIKIVDEKKKEDLINKYQSRKVQEAELLNKQLKNDHSVSARQLSQFQKTFNSIEPKENSYDTAKKILVDLKTRFDKPVLGKGLMPGQMIDFNKKISATELAKRKAIEMVKNRRIEKKDPNNAYLSSNKKTKFELANILNKVENNLNETEENLNSNISSEPKFLNSEIIERRKRKAQEEVQAKKMKLDAINSIMNRKSNHEHEVNQLEVEAQNKYFNLMEKKEKIEERLENTNQTECSIIICKICQYTTDQKQSDLCKNKKHVVIHKKAIKRFFRCKDCKTRLNTFNQIYPIQRCKCGSDSFEKTSMFNIKAAPKLENEKLLIRGEELKFLSSLK